MFSPSVIDFISMSSLYKDNEDRSPLWHLQTRKIISEIKTTIAKRMQSIRVLRTA